MSNYSNRQYPSAGDSAHQGSYPAYPTAPSTYGTGSTLDIKKSFNQLLQLLKRGAWLIGLVFLVVGLLVTVATLLMKPEYSASTLLILNTDNNKAPNQDALDFGRVDAAGMDASKATQTLILQESILIAERTVDRLFQEGNKIKGTDIDFTFLDKKEDLVDALGHEPTVTDWAKYLQENYIRIRSEGDWQTGAIRIEVRSENPIEAAEIANTYADEYKRFSQEASRQQIVQSKAFLEDQITKHKTELQTIEDRIAEYQRSQSAVSLEAASTLTVTEIATLEAQLNEARVEKSMLERGITAKEQQLANMAPSLSQGLSEGLEEEIGKVRQRIEEIENKLEPIYQKNPELRDDPSGEPFVMGMTQQLATYRQRLRTLSEQYAQQVSPSSGTGSASSDVAFASTLKNDIENDKVVASQLDSKINELRRTIAASSGKLRAIPSKSQELAQLERQRQSAEASYLSLNDKLQEARIAEESKVGFAEILRPAFTPAEPDKPNKPRNIALGLLLGLMMGVGAAIVRHWMDSKIYSPDDITSMGVTLLGAVPDMADVIKSEFKGARTADFKGRQISTGLATLLTPASPTSEAYRRLYVNLQFSMPDRVVQTVLVTSPEASVGKSTTSINLAITAAKAKRKTLIIGADFHRPTVARYLGLGEQPDLSKLLDSVDISTGSDSFDPMMNGAGSRETRKSAGIDGLSLADYATGIDNLFAIAPERPLSDPAEQLGSREFRVFLQRLKDMFDVIIIDTPPVLLTADAAIVATQADATIVVAAAGATDREALEHSIGELNSIGANVVGAVINKFDPSSVPGYKSTYKYRYQYYNEYYRGDRQEKLATS
ncbi:MAG: AAA family ATPase [Bacteroidetes bacterium]|nr:AAA family ATPase [Bacteroidota bacterium]